MAASTLSERLRAGGIVADPEIVIREAQRAGIKLALACALLEKETAGGHNVFGHDRDRSGHYIFPARDGTVQVTEDLYRQYKARRKASGLPQGVGPCQLTFAPFQDQADELGGCWKPAANIRVGFKVLADNVRANGLAAGVARYNGSGPAAAAYSRDVLAKARRWQALLAGAPVPKVAASRLVRRGDRGERVERITRRLSFVHSPRTKAAYLDGARKQFDAEAVSALKAFQRDHGLLVDGVFGDESARRLVRAVRAEKARRKRGGSVVKPPAPAKPSVRAAQLPALVKDVRKLEAETGEAWEELVDYARKRARLLARIQDGGGGKPEPEKQPEVVKGLEEMTAILLRIEAKLGELSELEEREEAREAAAAVKASAATAEVATIVETASAIATSVEVSQLDEIKAPPPEGPVPPASANGLGAAAAPMRRLADLSDAELLERIVRLDRATVKARDELVRRYAKVEREIARLRPKLARPPKRTTVTPKPKKVEPRPVVTKDDPQGGKVVVTKLGDRGLLVRRSKLALGKFLAAKGNAEHVPLRRALRREARRPKKASLATAGWRQAVKAAQHLTGRPVTGELDGELVRLLQPYWPRDNVGKRALRSTPGAWRAIPGQLTPNFNVKELACKDAAHTGYVEGLMREQRMTKRQAKERAKGLAKRLERLRKLGGDRPLIVTSAFRTRAYNASLTGSATNSAHTRGFAVDTPPPRGVSLTQHEAHALDAFECGVGIYPPPHGTFIHGDFDHTLGGRRRWRP
jgi:uncharacterized protein YcbK (DUF882 family)/peptidoglycan hydrolase-like protein with peptidoglycan-binding domain